MNKLLLAVLLTSNVAMAGDWDDLSRMTNDNIRTRAYANPPVVYIPPPIYIAPPVYIAPIQGNPNAGSYNFNNNVVVPSTQDWSFK